MDEKTLATLRQACFHSRERYEQCREAWCFNCRAEIDWIEFDTSGWYEGPKTGEAVSGIDYKGRPYTGVLLSDPDGDTPVCPWCHSTTLLPRQAIEDAGVPMDNLEQLLRQLKARYVRKSTTPEGCKAYEVLDE